MATRISSGCSAIGQVAYHAASFYMQLGSVYCVLSAGRVWRRRKGHRNFGAIKFLFLCNHSTKAQMDFESEEGQSQDQDQQPQQVDLLLLYNV